MAGGLAVSSARGADEEETALVVVSRGDVTDKALAVSTDGNEQTIIAKVLVPEEQLAAGKSPIDHIARGWIKLGNDAEPQAINDDNRGPLPIFLAGPGTDHKSLEATKLENAKLGEIEAAGDSGTIEYQEQTRKLAAKYETRRHEKAPFGVVSMTVGMV